MEQQKSSSVCVTTGGGMLPRAMEALASHRSHRNLRFALAAMLPVVLWLPAAHAATYYVSDCQEDAAAGCVPGNDNLDGKTPATAWRSTGKVASVFAGLAPGETIRFAQGGAWKNAHMRLQNERTSAANRITLESYATTWGSSAKPILVEARAGYAGIYFADGNSNVPDGGYVVRDLDIRGKGTGLWGVMITNKARDILLDDLIVSGFEDVGVYCGIENSGVTLRNSKISNNPGQGALWGCVDSTIDGNTFSGNATRSPKFDHAIYVGVSNETDPTRRGWGNVISNNTIKNSNLAGGRCSGVPFVVHGRQDGLLIEGNTVIGGHHETEAQGGCWGIAVDNGYIIDNVNDFYEYFTNLVIRGNTVVNTGGYGIEIAVCQNCTIENNRVYKTSTEAFTGIAFPGRERSAQHIYGMQAAVIRNNSVHFTRPGANSIGILAAADPDVVKPNEQPRLGSKHQVVSNLVSMAAVVPGDAKGGSCFNTLGLTLASFEAFDHNLCYRTGGAGRYSQAYATLTEARAAGFDLNGSSAFPAFVVSPTAANPVMRLQSTSPCIGAGHPTRSTSKDIENRPRDTKPDCGAYEYIAKPAPVAMNCEPAGCYLGGNAANAAASRPIATKRPANIPGVRQPAPRLER